MKTIILVALIVLVANISIAAAISCDQVEAYAAPCVDTALGPDGKPNVECCDGVKELAQKLQDPAEKKEACWCVRGGGNIDKKFVSEIPQACNLELPITATTDCQSLP